VEQLVELVTRDDEAGAPTCLFRAAVWGPVDPVNLASARRVHLESDDFVAAL